MRSLAIPLALIATALGTTELAAQDDGCSDTRYPSPLPTPTALVDSARAVADLAVFAKSKPMLFSLLFNPGDSLPHIRPLDKSDSAAAVTLSNYVRRQRPADLWAIRVRIVGGDAPALALEHSTYCPPVPRYPVSNRPAIIATRNVPRQQPIALTPRGIVVHAEALVAADGRVIRARVTQSSGSAKADYQVVRELQRQHFQPARLDGEPIEALYRTGEESPRP